MSEPLTPEQLRVRLTETENLLHKAEARNRTQCDSIAILTREREQFRTSAEDKQSVIDLVRTQRDTARKDAEAFRGFNDEANHRANVNAEIAQQHARQRDEAMSQRDAHRERAESLMRTEARKDREHREALDALHSELLGVRRQAEELAVLYGKARLDSDKAIAEREGAQAVADAAVANLLTATKERDAARKAVERLMEFNAAPGSLDQRVSRLEFIQRQREEAARRFRAQRNL
jgi:hypothetical protein